MLHLHLRRRRELLLKPRLLLREARLLLLKLWLEARLLLRGEARLAAERGGASVLRLLRIALLGRKPLLLLRISLLRITRLLLYKLRLLLGITLLRRREALLTKTHGRLLRRLRPV